MKVCKKTLIVLGTCFAAIVAYHFFYVRGDPLKDPLNKVIFNWGGDCCSSWPMTHLVVFALLGATVPQSCLLPTFLIGILWEIVETIVGIATSLPKHILRTDETVQYDKSWWTGSIKDVLFNGLGLLIGYTLRWYI